MGKEKDSYGHHPHSQQALIELGDKEYLKQIGMTRSEAKKKLSAWLKDTAINASAMERWYHEEVRYRRRDANG